MRVLIIGANGFMGEFIAEASCLDAALSTYILFRSPLQCSKLKVFEDKGATLLHGDITDQENVKKILKEHKIDIVISAIGGLDIKDQIPLLHAIKDVGTIKRFLPSEFGHDVDKADPIEPGLTMYKEKREIRRLIEELSIPYTYICCNSLASWPYYDNHHPSQVLPPLHQFQIYGDGTVKAYFVDGSDIGKFTIKAANDIRTLNKSLHFRPSCNFLNMNELAALWEKKIGKILPRVTVSEDDLLAVAGENVLPKSIVASFTHDIFIKGCQTNFTIDDGNNDVEATSLYPEEPFRTMDDCFNDFLLKVPIN